MSCDQYEIDPTLKHILKNPKLNWLFVGGKGGVGKTTTSCSIARLLSSQGKRVLLISTDPAHNLSDILMQQVNDSPTPIKGAPNFEAMEISPKAGLSDLFTSENGAFLQDILSAIPGIDEAIGFAELMKQVQAMTHDVVVFDTAPTGHTLKFLGFPAVLEKGVAKAIELRNQFGGFISQMRALFQQSSSLESAESALGKLDETKAIVEAVNERFRNEETTGFVCVCIPEYLSVYETKRLAAELEGFGICCDSLVVNQVLFPPENSECVKCTARVKMQRKYLEEINDLFEKFHIVTTPLLNEEVRGLKLIDQFSSHLVAPYGTEETTSE